MAITSLTKQQLSATSFLVTAVSNAATPVYYWYQDGALLEVGARPFRQFDLVDGESVSIEVFDTGATAPAVGLPGRITLQWDAVTGATAYRVDTYNGATWDEGRRQSAGAASHFRYQSSVLADCEDHKFGIVPIGVNEGARREITVHMIRKPDQPTGTFSYNAGTGVLTVA